MRPARDIFSSDILKSESICTSKLSNDLIQARKVKAVFIPLNQIDLQRFTWLNVCTITCEKITGTFKKQ